MLVVRTATRRALSSSQRLFSLPRTRVGICQRCFYSQDTLNPLLEFLQQEAERLRQARAEAGTNHVDSKNEEKPTGNEKTKPIRKRRLGHVPKHITRNRPKPKPKSHHRRILDLLNSSCDTTAYGGFKEDTKARRIDGIVQPWRGESVLEEITPDNGCEIARLAHGLERVLFNPGVHWVQDPRSRVYNFSPELQNIPSVDNFAFDRLGEYVSSSRDGNLHSFAKEHSKRFAGSTSSLTGLLSQIYFLISEEKLLDTSLLSRHFTSEPRDFVYSQRIPISAQYRLRDGVYCIDSIEIDDKDKNILLWMGTVLEKYLTMSEPAFNKLLRSTEPSTSQSTTTRHEAYRYAKSKLFLMRAQLDCYEPRLPGSGVFDIKTRAAVPIRQDILSYKEHSGYLIRTLQGPLESFEKEYYDLIRSGFLKYSLQARIGNMDGVMVAYHNTERMFGFQYIPLVEMEERIFGSSKAGEPIFQKLVGVLESLSEEIVRLFPGESVECVVEKPPSDKVMDVYVFPVDWDTSTGPKPVKLLHVSCSSLLHGRVVPFARCVESLNKPWELRFSVTQSTQSAEEISSLLDAAVDRMSMDRILPPGVSEEEMVERWSTISYGGTQKPVASASDEEPAFRPAGKRVKLLREVSRKGRLDTERMAEEQKAEEVVVLPTYTAFSTSAAPQLVETATVVEVEEDEVQKFKT